MTHEISITVAMENETDAPGQEAARILRELADRLQDELLTDSTAVRFPLRDANGNSVGQAVIRG